MKSQKLSFLSLFLLSGALAACSATGVPLAGDQVIQSLCPDSGCVDAKADVNQLTIKGPGTTSMQSKVIANDTVQFGGDCYASTYPNNRIRVSLYTTSSMTSGSQIALSHGSGSTAGDVISVFQDPTPRCVQGRYHIAIRGSKMPLVSGGNFVYWVSVAIIGIDESGLEYTNDNTGKFKISVTRHQ